LLTVRPSGVTRYARQYSVGQRRWIGDTRVSANSLDSYHHEPHPLQHVHATFASGPPDADPHRNPDRVTGARRDKPGTGDGFFDQVLEAAQASHPDATVTPRPETGYLRISQPLPGGGAEQWPVGMVDGEVTGEQLQSFVQRVHRQFASADPSVRSELVYSGPPATDTLVIEARRHGVRLRSFVDYQGLIDLRPLAARQAERLAADPIYPAQLYVPQRYRLLDNDPDASARDNLLEQVIDWLGADSARFVMLLGDFGRGKTFLLRELARTLPQHLPGLLPVLVELRSLEKAPSLDELLAQHLVRHNVEDFNVTKLRYMIRRGRLALLFDGFDELELRVGFDNAADYLNILLRAVTDNAKVVLTSRTQHFRSTAQIRTALGDQATALPASRVAILEDFTGKQILRFLNQHYDGDAHRAQARFDLLGEVRDLLGLSRNPRMLSFIADLDEQRLRDVQAKHGQISAAELYRELVDFWLLREADRHQHRA
ncbi:MAG: NACHT domain-containing protein, partial [Pseudonocardiaceae bacterium]